MEGLEDLDELVTEISMYLRVCQQLKLPEYLPFGGGRVTGMSFIQVQLVHLSQYLALEHAKVQVYS